MLFISFLIGFVSYFYIKIIVERYDVVMKRMRATIPILILFLFLQRYYVEGVASTGIKG